MRLKPFTCPDCGSQDIRINTRCILPSYPPQTPARCETCGHTWNQTGGASLDEWVNPNEGLGGGRTTASATVSPEPTSEELADHWIDTIPGVGAALEAFGMTREDYARVIGALRPTWETATADAVYGPSPVSLWLLEERWRQRTPPEGETTDD